MKLFSGLFVISSLAIAPIINFQSTTSTTPSKNTTAVGFSVKHIDKSVSPKVDFYKFAAGNWLKNAVIPDDNFRVDSFTHAEDQRNQKVLTIMEQAAAKSSTASPGSATQQVGDLYRSAMNTKILNKLGISPLKPDLDKIAALSSKEDLITLMASQSLMGIPSVFTLIVEADVKQAKVSALYVKPIPHIEKTLGKDFYLSSDSTSQRKAYIAHITKILELAGETPSKAATQAKTILQIETVLAKAIFTPTEAADVNLTYNKKQIAQFKSETPNIDWDRYFSTIGLSGIKEIIVTQPKYMVAANQLLGETSLDDWKTYLRWRVLNSNASFLSEDFAQEHFNFFTKTILGTQQRQPRNQEVAEVVRTNLEHPTAKLYVDKYFPPATKAKAEEMVKNIKAEFRLRLEQNTWMSAETRKQALDKLDKIKEYVGYPETWLNYSRVKIDPNDYLGNITRLNQWQSRRNFDKLGKPFVSETFTQDSNSTSVNATYEPSLNIVQIPAAILQAPFFDASGDDAVNYCAIGAIIGHEFTHGFDSQGRLYDAEGNLKDWWTKEDAQKFEAKANQLVEQYNKYEALPGLFVNGKLSLGENIADLGGILTAHSALQRHLTAKQRSSKIDGYTPGERCFIAWGQVWKSQWRPEILRKIVLNDAHPPGQFRAMGSLTNTSEFFSTFDIKPGDPMWRDEKDRVKIW
ncbi:M13 family metallopeptidase [Nostoc sp. FACHB-152]|uniref:M13 family metallopeptidase n=1 Tax=unclassified Nostoc TaxID=2593658 RepID=UPI001688DC49|nr:MULTISPECIES: M13 family metallopeptidase [unclassified Nostoc]MBD2450731.1 M13 family metallopeptidase [Nostoc sp. FACHB-152]MBD2471943.1 M13 family metallopeptidase [Nostoc sp. FACHB-145]